MTESEQQGLIHVYTGNGKGKSTAAFGLAVRASGCGLKTVIVQFMKKGEWYGEINTLNRMEHVSIYSYGGGKFLRKGNPPDEENLDLAAQAMAKAREAMADPEVRLLILDELSNAVYFDLISEEEALALIADKPSQMELVITGRNAPQSIIDRADYVTEMCEIKHPYQKGVQARKGIEY